MFQHVTYGDLPFEVVEAEAGAEGELGHVDNLDCKLGQAIGPLWDFCAPISIIVKL